MSISFENAVHISVLRDEVLDVLLNDETLATEKPWFLDGTLGLAGHSKAILETCKNKGVLANLCGLDRDPQALERASLNLQDVKEQCYLFEKDFASFTEVLPEIKYPKFNGILLDLGVSSLQLDVAERGFSYHKDGQLNMRMDMGILVQKEANPYTGSAKTFVNKADFETLKKVITELGEDPLAAKIASAIIEQRQKNEILTTKQLADIVYNAYPAKWRANARNHPATRTFQAIRMYVNDELGQLNIFLDNILEHMAENAVLAIISFHSLEDRIVKQKFKLWNSNCICPPQLPYCNCKHRKQVEILTKKPIVPSKKECNLNPRASSAKLRAIKKI